MINFQLMFLFIFNKYYKNLHFLNLEFNLKKGQKSQKIELWTKYMSTFINYVTYTKPGHPVDCATN